jgi:hypothetical protein
VNERSLLRLLTGVASRGVPAQLVAFALRLGVGFVARAFAVVVFTFRAGFFVAFGLAVLRSRSMRL